MDSLYRQLARLYFSPSALAGAPACVAPAADGRTRLLALKFLRAADWPALARVHEIVQQDLGWPAGAVSVDNRDGFTLWLSLAEAVDVAMAQALLRALAELHLPDLPPGRLRLLPDADGSELELPPALCRDNDKWSAFIDPTLGSMFADEAGLDLPPNLERQADLLARLESVGCEEFRRAQVLLLAAPATGAGAAAMPAATAAELLAGTAAPVAETLIGGGFSDPQAFLQAVMNHPAIALALRIEAAKALLSASGERGAS